MRRRTTFHDESLCVGGATEFLLYGSRAARAYAQIKPARDRLRQEIVRHIPERRRAIRVLRDSGFPFWQACEMVRAMYPDHPTFCDLARLGYDLMYAAADADTEEYSNAIDTGAAKPFTPCASPREAWEQCGKSV